tara:strand:- start:845 stop:3100 length:2256 start_codon:yes stop_codon:yes gene_type:complete
VAIKSKIIKFREAPAIDQRFKESSGGAESIKNFRIDPSGDGWLADRGLEPWKDFSGALILGTEVRPYLNEKMDSIYIWAKQGTGQVYHIFEQGGELYYLWGNPDNPTTAKFWRDKITIATGRHIPKINDPGTQYIPYGDKLLIINGFDKPIWFEGNENFRDFGFTIPTPEIEVLPVQVSYLASPSVDIQRGTAAPNFTNNVLGLGDRADDKVSAFNYKMTFITDTGSESPLSSAASVSWENASANAKRFGIFLNELPTGKDGVVARRIYRTKNQRVSFEDNAQSALLFLVKQINDNSTTEYIDAIPDNALIVQGPELTDSSIISSSYQFGANWNGRLWLAGGKINGQRIIYSASGLPEQFGQFNYFDVGSTGGGDITQLYAYYNNLLVFRENAIDIIRDNGGTFTISQLTPDVGTNASNTICFVPGIGVVFLNKDGLYAISGGLDGGSSISIGKISDAVGKEIQNVNVPALPSATAAYSKKEKEYWLHYTRKGESVPSRGIVIHSYNKTFSFRGANDRDDEYKWYFSKITTDPDGNFIIGTLPDWRSAGTPVTPTTVGGVGRLVHAQVWSGAPYWGKTYTVSSFTGDPQVATYAGANDSLQSNIWQSNWMDFGDASVKHRVFGVEMQMVSYGDNLVELDWGYDYDSTWYSAGGQKVTKPETVFTLKEDPVYGPADATVTKRPFTINTDTLKGERIVVIRWDVNTALVDNFRFRVKQTNGKPFHILGFAVNYDTREQAPLNQRIRLQKGQPR